MRLEELPDVLLFRVLSFTASPTHRASVICHQLAPLSQQFSLKLSTESEQLWETILVEDYRVTESSFGGETPRSSKRLRRGAMFRVREAHKLIRDNTEIAYFYLSELVAAVRQQHLTRSSFLRLLNEYGPHLRYNQMLSTGGIFLVTVCQAKNTRERTILQCVQELVERRGAEVNKASSESANQSLTALAVAAARGMHTVVLYLLRAGADPNMRSSGRFQLHSNPRKTVAIRNHVPFTFSNIMQIEEEKENSNTNVAGLRVCQSVLSKYMRGSSESMNQTM